MSRTSVLVNNEIIALLVAKLGDGDACAVTLYKCYAHALIPSFRVTVAQMTLFDPEPYTDHQA